LRRHRHPGECVRHRIGAWQIAPTNIPIMLERILQPLERLRPFRYLIERRWTPDIAELAVVLEVRFDEVATSCRGYDFGRAATEELRDAQSVVVVAVGAYDDVFELSGWVEGLVVVVRDGAVLEMGAEVDVVV